MFLPWLEDDEHLLAKGLCQLFLDTPSYNAHVTGTDVLWVRQRSLSCRRVASLCPPQHRRCAAPAACALPLSRRPGSGTFSKLILGAQKCTGYFRGLGRN